MDTSAYNEVRVAHIQRNIRVTVVKHPSWMSDALKDALVAILERHAIQVNGLRSGFKISNNGSVVEKELAFGEIDFLIPELSNCEISETLNAWADEAIKAVKDAPSFGANVELGLGVLFYELNPTHTHAVRAWYLEELFPQDTGVLNAYLDLNSDYERFRDSPLEDSPSMLRVGFDFDRAGSNYNKESTLKLIEEILKKGPPSHQGYAEPMRPGDVYVFTVDPHDPDPVQTVEFIKQEVKNRGVNVVILDPNVKALLESDQPIDFAALKAGCIQPPAEWEGIEPTNIKSDDLRLRELRLNTDRGSLQSQYWNYAAELAASVYEPRMAWTSGGNMLSMPADAVEKLNAKLDELGIPTADQLREQGWQPPAFPRQLDPLQSGECEIQNRRRADNFPDVNESNAPDFVANIQIPQSLQHATEEHRSRISDAPYGSGYRSTPAPTSQPGNEIPEGWKAPHVDIDSRPEPSSSNDDSGSTQSSD